MINIRATAFNWDGGNREKCTKHGITAPEIEAFFQSREIFISPDWKHSTGEERYIAIGRMPNGRAAFVAFTYRSGKIRPISVRYMHQKERLRYEKIIAEAEE